MSMTVFMIWQMIGIFCAYFGVTLVLPLIVFRSLLRGKTVTNQILFSYLIGNFYIITMVQILQLLKISHTITLILATIVPAYIVWVKLNKVEVVKSATEVGTNVKRVTEKQMGVKTAGVRIWRKIRRSVRKVALMVKKQIVTNWIEILLQVFLFVILIWVYGIAIVQQYGYTASDIPVHNYWINAMGKNNIFVAGVYPHGYHCMIYYIHEVFGFDTYVILSLFAFVQVVCIHFMLLLFLRLCCKAKYIAYIGVFMYAAGDFFISATYYRFASTLPQEFGMIFILPAIYYGFEFFELRYKEVKAKEKKKESWYSLFGFAMGFGITLSAHFYNTIIAGLFCVAMAIGYLFLFVRKQYFGNVVITCLISVLVAILPMGIAFATGTPLEGSLYWARSVIVGTTSEDNSNVVNNTEEISNGAEKTNRNENQIDLGEQEEPELSIQNDIVKETVSQEYAEHQKQEDVVKNDEQPRISIKEGISRINARMSEYLWTESKVLFNKLFWMAIIFLLVEGLLFILMRKVCYGAMLITAAIYMVIMVLLLSAGEFGFPALMDPGRCCIYVAYCIPMLFVFPLDGMLFLVLIKKHLITLRNVVSLLGVVVLWIYIVSAGKMRATITVNRYETNEAITTLTNIIRCNDNFTWTICSANDEFRMCEEKGYHYETIVFLREIENWSKDKIVTLPSEKVYFFVEKDCTVTNGYWGTDKVSEEGAKKRLSHAGGLAPYQGENRWITMSHMYYWAQEMLKMYPNEMKVYMETDNFVCYVLEQNTYSLVNLAIDYGYNTGEK